VARDWTLLGFKPRERRAGLTMLASLFMIGVRFERAYRLMSEFSDRLPHTAESPHGPARDRLTAARCVPNPAVAISALQRSNLFSA
jgi:hypothetical protein